MSAAQPNVRRDEPRAANGEQGWRKAAKRGSAQYAEAIERYLARREAR